MNDTSVAFAKLAGIRNAVHALLDEQHGRRGLPARNFSQIEVELCFKGAVKQLHILRDQMPNLFGDFVEIRSDPELEMAAGAPEPMRFSLAQLKGLRRAIDQIFEIRANSELAIPEGTERTPRVFISHGRASDWREVQSFIERDIEIPTLELEQEPNLGRTVLQKLDQEAPTCTSAVIVMTGDDIDADGNRRARENVMHEIGFLQAKFGLSGVCVLHEEETSIPSNIHGLVYIPFPQGHVRATFGALGRELKSFYGQ